MEIPVAAPKALLADKEYDGDRFRESLLIRGILPIIPPRSNRKVPEHPDYRRYRDRNRVERMFGKLKQQRRIATRYDKTVLSFESFLNLAATRLWLKSFVNTAYKVIDKYDRSAETVRQLFNNLTRFEKLALIYPNSLSSFPRKQPSAVGGVRILSLDYSDKRISAEFSPTRRCGFKNFQIVIQQIRQILKR